MNHEHVGIFGVTLRNWLTLLFCSFLLFDPVFSGTTGKIAGRILDKTSGEPLIGANVMVVGTPLGAATDTEGNYYILQVSPGSYDVKFTMIGYQALIMNDVRIRVDVTTTPVSYTHLTLPTT